MMNLEEIYPVINFLLDEKNTHTNAQEIFVDGGWLSWQLSNINNFYV